MKQQQTGSILLIVVFLVMLLSLWVLDFARSARFFQKEAGHQIERKKAYQAAQAGLEYGLFLLASGEETFSGKKSLGDGAFSYQVRNEDGLWDVNQLVDGDGNLVEWRAQGLSRYLVLAGLKDKEIVHCLADWIDADAVQRTKGAEHYLKYSCKNGLFDCLPELRLVKGLEDPVLWPLLRSGMTVYSGGKINVNSAPKGVLLSLSEEMTEPLAEAIIARKTRKRFQELDELKEIPGFNDRIFSGLESYLTVQGSFYTVASAGMVGKTEVRLEAVAERKEDQLHLVWLKELSDDESF